jgi:hypothetical protein
MGLTHYVHVDQFSDVKKTFEKYRQFRFINEVIGLVKYCGAYTLTPSFSSL